MTFNTDKSSTALQNALRGLNIDPAHALSGLRAEHPFPVAVRLAMTGYKVIPTQVKTKIPCIKDWPRLATTNPGDLATWQHQFNPNWSVLTGRDNNLVILDVDGERGRADLARMEARLGLLPKTIRCCSGREGGGFHVWLRPPTGTDDLRNQQPLPGTKIDVRGWHGHAVIAGSLHRSGARYSWDVGSAPDEVELAECPQNWWEFLPKKENESTFSVRPKFNGTGGDAQHRDHDPASFLIGDGPGFGGFHAPINGLAIRYFISAGPDASPEPLIAWLRKKIEAAPKDPGRDVTRYLSDAYLYEAVESARNFVRKMNNAE